MTDIAGDDSRGFAAVERAHIREKYLPDWDWMFYHAPTPHHPPPVPLEQARIGLVDTCGAQVDGRPPVGASGRAAMVPVDAAVAFNHSGYDVTRAERDNDVVHPAHTLLRLAQDGVIGSVAPVTVSVMGGVLLGERLLQRGVPATVESMLQQQVDLALLVPA